MFDDNDDDVARIAQEMERKYGNSISSSRTTNNMYDKGMGYDEQDDFIDNTEAVRLDGFWLKLERFDRNFFCSTMN